MTWVTFENLYFLFLLAVTLHNLEEAVWLPDWSQQAGRWHRPVEKIPFRFAVLVLTLLAYLFAYFGLSKDNDPNFQANGIIRKESSNGPWIVDYALPPNPTRVETMLSISFKTDTFGNPQAKPVDILIAAIWSASNKEIHVRNDEKGVWGVYPVTAGRALVPGETFSFRAFGSHVDKVTGVHSLFGGAWMMAATFIRRSPLVGFFPAKRTAWSR
jgi:hypothetical protein